MTDKEINDILNELENDSLTQEQIAEIQAKEAQDLEEMLPNENVNSDRAWGWARKEQIEPGKGLYEPALNSVASESAKKDNAKSNNANKERAIDRKRRKQEIINEAINSTTVDLNTPLSVEHKKLLISLLTKNYVDRMEHHDKYITSKIERCLKRSIPNSLLDTFKRFPDTVVPFPGFTYCASEEYGKGHQFKVRLNLPLYFKPEDCDRIVKELLSENELAVLDKAVAFFYYFKEVKAEREMKIAKTLLSVTSFFQLVKKNPFWYETLITEIEKQRKENGRF